MNTAALTVRYLKTFNRLIVGSLIVLLSSCASLKAPKTLFITYGIDEQEFRAEITQIRSFLNKYTEAFQRSNPGVNVVFINYKSKNLYDQITKDSSLNLGDLSFSNLQQLNCSLAALSRHYPNNKILILFIANASNQYRKQTQDICMHHG